MWHTFAVLLMVGHGTNLQSCQSVDVSSSSSLHEVQPHSVLSKSLLPLHSHLFHQSYYHLRIKQETTIHTLHMYLTKWQKKTIGTSTCKHSDLTVQCSKSNSSLGTSNFRLKLLRYMEKCWL